MLNLKIKKNKMLSKIIINIFNAFLIKNQSNLSPKIKSSI